MSIVVHLFYTGADGAASRFAEEMESSGIAQRIRSEEGNLRYDYFRPLSDPETILLIDEWKDQAALDQHHASEMMQELAMLRNKYDLHMKAERYISEEMPASDQPFIRK